MNLSPALQQKIEQIAARYLARTIYPASPDRKNQLSQRANPKLIRHNLAPQFGGVSPQRSGWNFGV
jgi:hypothetical protein